MLAIDDCSGATQISAMMQRRDERSHCARVSRELHMSLAVGVSVMVISQSLQSSVTRNWQPMSS